MKRLLYKLYQFLGKYLGVVETDLADWHKVSVHEAKGGLTAVNHVSKHKLDNIERSVMFAADMELGSSMPVDISVDGKLIGSKTTSIQDIEDRVLREHYEDIYKKSGRVLTKFIVHRTAFLSDEVNAIECQTTFIKSN